MILGLTNFIDCFGRCLNYNYYYPEFNKLDTIAFSIISVIVILIYFKNRRNGSNDDRVWIESESLDVLMQPKNENTVYKESLPFSQISLKIVYSILTGVILFLSVVIELISL